jgi:hypothetical protein
MRYRIHFFSPIYEPWVYDVSKTIIGAGGAISNLNLFGNAPLMAGLGSETVSVNTVTFPKVGDYTLALYVTGSSIIGGPTVTWTGSPSNIVNYGTVYTTSAAISNWNFSINTPNSTATFLQPGTIVSSRMEISPN